MQQREIVRRRLTSQGLVGSRFETVEQVMEWMIAVQSQERAIAPWSLGLRAQKAVGADVQQALANGSILRTHVLRPTWHYVSNADARWLLELSAPHVHGLNRPYYRKLELDAVLLAKCCDIIARSLEGHHHLTRVELQRILETTGVAASGLRLGYILMYAELERVICSGSPHGKHHTYALFEERVPKRPALSHDEALATLTEKFFASRGPATLRDYSIWSGLTITQARLGLDKVKDRLESRQVNDLTYWMAGEFQSAGPKGHQVDFLQGYDEYMMSYRDTRGVHAATGRWNEPQQDRPFLHVVLMDGRFVGRWQRQVRSRDAVLDLQVPARLVQTRAIPLKRAVERYQAFLELPVQIRVA